MNDFVVSLMLLGALGTQTDALPFWATANQYGILPESNGKMALLRAGTSFDESKTLQWRWGASLGLRDDFRGTQFIPDEVYASLRWTKLRLDAGMIRPEQMYLAADPALGPLSVTAGNCMMSGNARTMPGYTLTLEPWDIPFTKGHLQLSGRFADWSTIDKRYVQGALVHDTAIYLHAHIGRHLSFQVGLDNYSVWAGVSPAGAQPRSFPDYLRVITARPGGKTASVGDQVNSLGDHRGRELFRAEYHTSGWTLSLQHDIPYDDRSGMILKNFPDGVNTICLSFKDKSRWISDIVYEYHTTMNQSGDCERRLATEAEISAKDPRLYFDEPSGQYFTIVGGGDNYCNNYEYRSGWTAFYRQIGHPLFFTRGYYETGNPSAYFCQGTWNNLLQAHHFGLSGSLFRKVPYRLVLTYSRNWGCWYDTEYRYGRGTRLEKPLEQFSAGFSAVIPLLRGALSLVPGLYYDTGEALNDGFAATFAVKYTFRKR